MWFKIMFFSTTISLIMLPKETKTHQNAYEGRYKKLR